MFLRDVYELCNAKGNLKPHTVIGAVNELMTEDIATDECLTVYDIYDKETLELKPLLRKNIIVSRSQIEDMIEEINQQPHDVEYTDKELTRFYNIYTLYGGYAYNVFETEDSDLIIHPKTCLEFYPEEWFKFITRFYPYIEHYQHLLWNTIDNAHSETGRLRAYYMIAPYLITFADINITMRDITNELVRRFGLYKLQFMIVWLYHIAFHTTFTQSVIYPFIYEVDVTLGTHWLRSFYKQYTDTNVFTFETFYTRMAFGMNGTILATEVFRDRMPHLPHIEDHSYMHSLNNMLQLIDSDNFDELNTILESSSTLSDLITYLSFLKDTVRLKKLITDMCLRGFRCLSTIYTRQRSDALHFIHPDIIRRISMNIARRNPIDWIIMFSSDVSDIDSFRRKMYKWKPIRWKITTMCTERNDVLETNLFDAFRDHYVQRDNEHKSTCCMLV